MRNFPRKSSPPMILFFSAAVSFIRSPTVNIRHLSSSHSDWRVAEPRRALLASPSAEGEAVETQSTAREHSARGWTQNIPDLGTTVSHFRIPASPWLLTPPPYLILYWMENEIAFYFIHFLHYLHVISTTTARRQPSWQTMLLLRWYSKERATNTSPRIFFLLPSSHCVCCFIHPHCYPFIIVCTPEQETNP